jgi:glutamate-ammonia-ligase adenylyltransferase
VKLRPGGGIEVEFIAQTLQLVTGVAPGCQNTGDALRRLMRIGAIPADQGTMLVHADRLWRTVQSMLRILVGRATNDLPPSAAQPLLRAMDSQLDVAGLRATLDATAAEVRAAFLSLVGEIT